MPGIMEYLNRNRLPGTRPLFFTQCVFCREYIVLIVDGHIRGVMEIAPHAFSPRAAERSGRDGNLIRARPHNRIEAGRIAADSNAEPAGMTLTQSILPSNRRAAQLTIS